MKTLEQILEEMSITSARKDREETVIRRYDENMALGMNWWKKFYDQSRRDVMFFNGDEYNNYQWAEESKVARNQPGKQRPMPTLNWLPSLYKMVLARFLADPPDIEVVSSAGSFSEKIYTTNGDLKLNYQDLIGGIMRKIWYDCNAVAQIEKCVKHSLVGGFGWLRLRDKYISDSNFDQTLAIECIDERWNVLIDPSASDQNYGDADWAVIRQKMSKDEFRKRYGMKAPTGGGGSWFGASGDNEPKHRGQVYVDEYFERVMVPTLLVECETSIPDGRKRIREKFFRDADTKKFVSRVYEEGGRVVRYRILKTPIVNWYRIGSHKILESAEWVGSRIPLVFVPGREFQDHDGKRNYKGMFSEAREAQRFSNFFVAQMIEAMVTSVKQGWLISAEQLAGNTESFQNSGMYDEAIYTFSDMGIGGGSNTPPPQLVGGTLIPQAEFAVMSQLRLTIMQMSGVTEADLGQQGNETSAKAIETRVGQGSAASLEFIENARLGAVSISRCALEVIPHFFGENDVIYMMDIRKQPMETSVPASWMSGKRMLNTESVVIRVRAGRGETDIVQSYTRQIEELIKQGNPAWMVLFVEMLDKYGLQMSEGLKERLIPMMDQRSLTEDEIKMLETKPKPAMTNEQQIAMAEAEATQLKSKATIMEAEMKAGKVSPEIMKMIEEVVVQVLEKQANSMEPPERAGRKT